MPELARFRRIYDDPLPEDGHRVLVDRVWPRGMRKDDARFDLWLPEIAPSTQLRQWYGHDPGRFAEFRRRYLDELLEPGQLPARRQLRDLAPGGSTTLLTATRDLEHSHAAVLAEWLNTAGEAG
jgi:uncharacterized protein YeaO (DUF488 family)